MSTEMTDSERIDYLRRLLNDANHKYYVLAAPELDDQEYDFLLHELEALERRHPEKYDPSSPTQRVGSDIVSTFQQVAHAVPMLSLANTYNEQDVGQWYEQIVRGLGGEAFEIVCEMKYDGLSISLTYDDGVLVRAVTRGDGVQGDEVTQNVKTIRSIPLRLQDGDYPRHFEIRGEVLLPWEQFHRLNSERQESGEAPFANPRNAAAGTLKLQNSKVVAARQLDAYLYFLLGDELPADNHYDNLLACQRWGFKTSAWMAKVTTLDDIMAFIHHWDTARQTLPIATDGIVLKVNSLRQQRALGMTAKAPRWAIAYKYKAARERTQLQSVSFQVGRTGAITPVANMSPVLLAGTIVRRATLNNASFIRAFDLHIGDYVYVEKGGEIIPKIVAVDTEARAAEAVPVVFPQCCPECGTPLVRYEGEAAHYCPNDTSCPPQRKGKIEHFVSRRAMNIIGLGKELIDDYYERGLIRDVADLYDLRIEQLWGDDTKRNKFDSAKNIIAAIEASKAVPFPRVLFALGIRFVGEVSAKSIAKYFRSIAAIQRATVADLCAVDGVGLIVAQSIVRWMQQEENIQLIGRLEAHGLQMALTDDDSPQSTVLEGKTIVISGVFAQHSRDEYKRLIEQHGGKNATAISKATTFVLAGSNIGPAKLTKARNLNIPLVSEDEFLALLATPPTPPAPPLAEGSLFG